jgi:HlyD family secretion protein
MEVRGKIDEADVGRLQVGQTTRFTVDAYPDRMFAGRVLQIRKSPEVVQNVVTYTAVISAPNPELLLLPGMTAALRIIISDTGDVLKIPNRALRFRPPRSPSSGESLAGTSVGSGSVWVAQNGSEPSELKVRLGASDENSTQVLGDTLQEGQPLIVGVAARKNQLSKLGLRFGF